MKKTYLNPYITYALSWSMVLILYSLKWSDLYPPISLELTGFFIFTILFTGILGLILSSRGYFFYKSIEYNLKQVKRLTYIYLVANILDVLYSHHIPFLSIIIGSEINDSSFGIPMLHPLIITMGIFLGLYIFHMMISTDKSKRVKLLPYFLISFLGVVIIYGRGLMFMTFFGCALIYAMARQIKMRVVLSLIITGISILFIFGWVGNVRIGEAGVRITTIGEATHKFQNSNIPDEFFWSYIYFSSPIANLEYNLQTDKIHNVDCNTIKQLLLSEIIPEFISNKFIYSDQKVEPNLITKALNVSSVYARSYTFAGWIGIWIIFFYILIYVFTILSIITIKSPYFVTSLVILNMMMVGNVFDNMMNYVFSYTLFFSIFFMITDKYKFVIQNVRS